jgi:hypothetical protein
MAVIRARVETPDVTDAHHIADISDKTGID